MFEPTGISVMADATNDLNALNTRLDEVISTHAKVFDSMLDEAAVTPAFLELGVILNDAFKGLNKAAYGEFKENVLSKMKGKSAKATLDKVFRIASNDALEQYKKRLPTGWESLSIVASLKECELEELMADGVDYSEVKRSDLTAKVRGVQGVKDAVIKFIKVKPIKLEKDVVSEIVVKTLEEMDEMIAGLLKDSGWEIDRPKDKIKPVEATTSEK